uniref:Glutamate NMDA receptor-associated protein 1 n=1 Tax=Ascaris suum TaxID=6253 RepID=F1L875_ASCSU
MAGSPATDDGDQSEPETAEAPKLERFGAAGTASEGGTFSTTPQHDVNNDEFVPVEVVRPLYITEFEDPAVRARFVQIVFSIVGAMVTVCTITSALPLVFLEVRLFIITNFWVYLLSWLAFTVVYIAIVCVKPCRSQKPLNIISLMLLTVTASVMSMSICSYHSAVQVVSSLTITVICCFAVMLFAAFTKRDLLSCYFIAFIIFIGAVCTMIAAIIVSLCVAGTASRIIWTVVSGLFVIVFVIYLAVDTQRMMGGSSCPIAPNEYVYASVQLFVDILFIFLNILGMSR